MWQSRWENSNKSLIDMAEEVREGGREGGRGREGGMEGGQEGQEGGREVGRGERGRGGGRERQSERERDSFPFVLIFSEPSCARRDPILFWNTMNGCYFIL